MSKKSPKEFAGIRNQGATCYLNTLLQTLYMSPEVKDAINRLNEQPIQSKKNLNKNISIGHQLKELFEKLDAKETGNTHGITRNLGIKVYKQQDVAEYFRKIVNKLAEESDGKTCNISQIYQSKVINSLTCLECNIEAPEECCLLDIPLSVHLNDCGSSIQSVNAALQDFLKAVILDGDNLCYCETCQKKTKTEMRYYFERLPQILVLQLKRFEFDYSMMTFKKLHNKVQIPLSLKFQKKQNKNNGKAEWCLNSMESKDTAMAHRNRHSCSVGSEFSVRSRSHESDERQNPQRGGNRQESKDTAMTRKNRRPRSLGSEFPDELNERQKAQRDGSCQIYSTYNLFAVCDHSGELGFGHYVAYIRPDSSSEWYCFNDTCVTVKEHFFPEAYQGNTVSTPCIRSSTAYLLMYRKEKENSNQAHVRGINVDEKVKRIKTRGICDGRNNGEQSFEPFNPSLENPPCKNQAQAKNRDETMEKTECRNQSETSIENGEEPVVGDKSDEGRKETRAKETEGQCRKENSQEEEFEQAKLIKIRSERKEKGKRPLLKQRKGTVAESEKTEDQLDELPTMNHEAARTRSKFNWLIKLFFCGNYKKCSWKPKKPCFKLKMIKGKGE
ncbi:ubiquitin carboxyl-terminal hydrolase 47-like [Pristis pectinata]|uniref:ubiquitin carboxyl-terminal hydrolase 47-like n=1 Tax=Pristis pectinata TaxID=685728 RepID=UPI00223CABE4|nr:ubiquitin carboxyl-terminal hydrolase 47-like [Pristis pectinata]XP_051874682.1 ubiquitin carboxyl-terminal hydrolase 47-like [Pristis pectinata]